MQKHFHQHTLRKRHRKGKYQPKFCINNHFSDLLLQQKYRNAIYFRSAAFKLTQKMEPEHAYEQKRYASIISGESRVLTHKKNSILGKCTLHIS